MIVLHIIWILHYTTLVTSNQNELYAYSLESGHKYVTTATEAPHHVLIVYGNLYCSGTLLRSKIVITTAGCVTAGPEDKIYVKVGASSITGLGQVIPVIEVKIHEYFGYYSKMDNDIAMLVLKDNVQFNSRIKKVLMIEPENDVVAGIFIQVTGWASQSMAQKYANLLLRTDMEIMEREECLETFNGLITPSNFCAKFQPERKLNDVGGPATHRQLLVGIMSFGALKQYDPSVAVFTNITYFHKWILHNTKIFLEKYCVLPKETSLNLTHDQDITSAELNSISHLNII